MPLQKFCAGTKTDFTTHNWNIDFSQKPIWFFWIPPLKTRPPPYFYKGHCTCELCDWGDPIPGSPFLPIQFFAQLLYGYGYWGPFFLEYEKSTVDCGAYDLDLALEDIFYSTSFELDPAFGNYITTEFNGKIKENFNCLISRSPENQLVNELNAYIDIYTQLLSEKNQSQA